MTRLLPLLTQLLPLTPMAKGAVSLKPEAPELHSNAYNKLQAGDIAHAIIVYHPAVKVDCYTKPSDFQPSCLQALDRLRPMVIGGINAENITMLRIRILLNRNRLYVRRFHSALMAYRQGLMRHGYSDANNHRLFGKPANTHQYKKREPIKC